MKFRLLIAPILMCLPLSVMANNADDCIADYEQTKAQFESASADAEYECIRIGTAINMVATGSSPASCSGEDEWHFEAQSTGNNPGHCTTRILGSAGDGCAADKLTRELSPGEAARWRNHLFAECRSLGPVREMKRGN